MIKSPRTKGELEKVLLMKRIFPNLANGFSEGLSYLEIAQKIIDFTDKDHPFRDLSQNTVARYVAWSLRGFNYQGVYYEGLKEDEVHDEVCMRRRKTAIINSGLIPKFGTWKEEEDSFIVELYAQGLSPKEIFRKYHEVKEFNDKTYNAIESRIYFLRKRGDIQGTQRIFWDGDLGFTALALLSMYRREGNYIKEIAEELDNFFYQGEGRVTKSKLDNFKKRNHNKLEEILRENEGFEKRSVL